MQFKFNRILYFGIVVCLVIMTAGIGSADEVNLELVAHLNTTHPYYSIAVSENYAYESDAFSGFDITDISNPSFPILAGRYEINGSDGSVKWADAVAVADDYAYVGGVKCLEIVNISKSSSSILVGSYDTGSRIYDVAVLGNYAYISKKHNVFEIVDISNPSSPKYVGSCDVDGTDIIVADGYAYLCEGETGLNIVDISNPSSPTFSGKVYSVWATDVAVADGYAYVVGDMFLWIVDISDPSSPTTLGQCEIGADSAWASGGISVSGNYAYVCSGENGLVVLNVSNSSSPKFAGSYDTAGYAGDVAVSGNYVYVADYANGLVILQTDIQNQDTALELSPIGNKIVNETELLSFTVSAKDADGDAITYSATNMPTGATFDASTKTFSWTPGTGTEGVYYVTFTATANGLNDSETIEITVSDWNPWNDPGSQDGEKIALSELQSAIYDWRFGVSLTTGELVDLTRLQGLIYSWRFV